MQYVVSWPPRTRHASKDCMISRFFNIFLWIVSLMCYSIEGFYWKTALPWAESWIKTYEMGHCLPNESARRLQLIYKIPSTQILNEMHITSSQGGRSCAKARWAFTEKIWIWTNNSSQNICFCWNIKIHRDSRTFRKTLAKKRAFWSNTVFLEQEVH